MAKNYAQCSLYSARHRTFIQIYVQNPWVELSMDETHGLSMEYGWQNIDKYVFHPLIIHEKWKFELLIELM
jgi:hypothetical protein